MIELYKKKIWNDEKTVNVLAEGCLNDNPKICASACKFFLTIQNELYKDSDSEQSSDEGGDAIKDIKQRKGSKMTKHRASKMEKLIK